jgi:hypothetical protein
MARASAASTVARPGGTLILGVLLLVLLGPAAARGASNGVTPDPAPQSGHGASTGSPSPDQAPQAASQPPQVSSSAAAPPQAAPVIPRPTTSGLALAPTTAGSQSTPTTTGTVAIRVSPVKRRAHTRTNLKHHTATSVTAGLSLAAVPWRGRNPLDVGNVVSSQPTSSSRNGFLLLLGALALSVLAIASASLLRLLVRMDGERGAG